MGRLARVRLHVELKKMQEVPLHRQGRKRL